MWTCIVTLYLLDEHFRMKSSSKNFINVSTYVDNATLSYELIYDVLLLHGQCKDI